MTVLVPTSLDDALTLLADDPSSLVLAGGTDLMVQVNEGLHRPDRIVALAAVRELRVRELRDGYLFLGAGLTYTELMAPEVAGPVPALAAAARTVGSPQIRNAGTLGGNLGTASPAGDTLPVLRALGASVEIATAGAVGARAGERRVEPLGEFLTGPKQTALGPGELITGVRVPLRRGPQEYLKVGVRNTMVIAVASLALVLDLDRLSVGIGLGSVGPVALDAPEASTWLADRLRWLPDRALLDDPRLGTEFGAMVAAASRPIDDHRSGADYRRHAVSVMARRRGSAVYRVSEVYSLHVNGEVHDVRDAWVGESLLYVLRERLGLPGAKAGCEQGECGSCSVLVDDVLVCACLVLGASVVGREVVTPEGLQSDERGALTVVQRAFVEEGAVQCGFCTPGLVMAVYDLLAHDDAPDELTVREAISGNLCRCTGYGRVLAAIRRAIADSSEVGA